MSERTAGEGGAGGAESLEAWRLVSDAVLRGLNHAVSNRVASVAAVSALLDPAAPPGAELVRTLAADVTHFEAALRLLRLLPAGRPAPPEPVLVADALADALALHAHHAGLGEALCTVEGDPAALLPVVVPMPAFLHALVLLLGVLAVHARRAGGRAVLRVGGDQRQITFDGETAAGVTHDDPPEAWHGSAQNGALEPQAVAAALRGLVGADAAVAVDALEGGGARYTLALPTLLELRKRR